MLLKQSSTAQPLMFLMIDEADHFTGLTGLTPTVTLSKAGGSFGAPAGSVSEVGNGWYKVAGNATDTDTLGPLVLHATATGADPVDAIYEVVAFDPQVVAVGALMPTTAGRTLDVTATGEAGIDWANVGNPTTSLNLSGTTVATVSTLTGHTAQTGDAYARIGAPAGASLSADVAAVKSDSAAILVDTAEIGAAGVGLSAIPKTGFKLASDGLDSISITAPTGVASNFREMLVQVWRRFFKRATETPTQLKTYADDNTTVITTQAVSNDGATQVQGDAS